MPLADVVQMIISILQYVLPAVFLWALTEKAVRCIVSAATGKSYKGLE